LQVAYYFSTIIKLYFVSFLQFFCVCLDVEFVTKLELTIVRISQLIVQAKQ